MAPVMAVLGQTPAHDATKILGLDNLGNLARNKLGCVPSPVHLGRGIPVPLPALGVVGLAIVHGIDKGAAAVVVFGLKSDSARKARVAAVGVLEDRRVTAGGLVAGLAVLGGEPLGVKGEAEVHLLGGHAAGEVRLDGGEGAGDRGVVVGDGVATVHEIIGHDLSRAG